jgi:hypothetical protein
MFTLGKGGGVWEVREKVEGNQLTRGAENTNMADCTVYNFENFCPATHSTLNIQTLSLFSTLKTIFT